MQSVEASGYCEGPCGCCRPLPPPEEAEPGQARKSKIYSKSGIRKEAVLWRFLARPMAQAGLGAGAPLEVGSTARGQTVQWVGDWAD